MNSDQPAGSALRLLVAFTLGMLAMAAVAVVVMLPMLRRSGPPEKPAQAVAEESPAIPIADPLLGDIETPKMAPPSINPAGNVRPAPLPVKERRSPAETAVSTPIVITTGAGGRDVNVQPTLVYADTPDAPRHLNVGGAWREAGGVISGKVGLRGNPPKERQIAIPATDPCGKLPNPPSLTQIYRVGADQGLGDVLVFLSQGVRSGPWALNAKTLPLFYTGCRIEPYVSAMQIGQRIMIHNLDEMMHNAHFMFNNRPNREVNKVFMAGSKALEVDASAPEMFARLKCDVHPWEFGYVSIFDHPFFAVTMEDGLFQLEGIPPGEYTLKVIHRKSGAQEKRVRVQHNVPNEVNFTFETVEL